ncbi:protein-disulfide reductase DsbD [Coxiella burnetii]|uniref:protein-disulfide reductase DsbD n=4 Tax=Coxiella burnetii TaxID=777 RepID=UPI0022326497
MRKRAPVVHFIVEMCLDKSMIRRLITLLVLFFLPIYALSEQPVPVDQAFQFSAMAKDYQTVIGLWNIKPGFYLYRNRIHFSSLKSADYLGEPLWPRVDTVKDYPGIGKLPVYQGQLRISVPVIKAMNQTLYLKVDYQGCSEKGFCYPPTTKTVAIDLAGNYMQPVAPLAIDIAPGKTAGPKAAPPITQQDRVTQLLTHKNLFFVLLSFFGFGLLLSFTPCVLPMIPVLSGIIVGQQKYPKRAFGLSLMYVLGMAITYAIAGVIFGFIGSTVQAAFQNPWLIGLFSLLFIAMALSLFGLYDLQLPQRWQTRLAQASDRQKHGTYLGTALMGALSTLILSPCVTPALVGVLGYISHTGNASLGGVALFTMGLGMGAPLLLLGAFSRKWLPKAGPWMTVIKHILGVLMLAVAVWLLARILPGTVTMFLWAALAVGSAIALGALSTTQTKMQKIGKTLGLFLLVYGIVLATGGLSGNTNPLRPISLASLPEKGEGPSFTAVYTLPDVEHQLKMATTKGQPMMIDFYADWCISCKEMEQFTFANQNVQKALAGFRLLRADVTRNDQGSTVLEKHFGVVAPPTVLFLDPQGKEIPNSRIVGEMSAFRFLKHLENLRS